MNPPLIFDKSFLESLNSSEAALLDHFFSSRITPLFFIETLADLEKEVHSGRTPEEVVGSIALKTPDMESHVHPHHVKLLLSELLDGQEIQMNAKIRRTGGTLVRLNNNQGMVYNMTEEEEAFLRWQRGEFLDLERQIAKRWRRSVTGIDYSAPYALFNSLYASFRKPRNLKDAKYLADTLIDLYREETSMRLGMSLLHISPADQEHVLQRWFETGKPPIREFAPYFSYLYSVDLFFYLSIGADLISRVRPAKKADNKVDIAYLYYLPFCRVFVSNDNLHERVVPLFLRDDQTFVKGQSLKADLAKLDGYYDSLPDEVKAKPLYTFAPYPPSHESFLVAELWDKYVPDWRKQQAEKKKLTPEAQKVLVDLAQKFSQEAQPVEPPAQPPDVKDLMFIHTSRQILPKKGKYMRVPPL